MFSFGEPEMLKKTCGYQAYNSMIALFAQELNAVFDVTQHSLIARMNEGDFLVMISFVEQNDIEK